MRTLNTSDIFSLCRLVDKSGVRDKLASLIESVGSKNTSTTRVGIEGFLTIAEGLGNVNCEKMLYSWLGSIFEVAPEDVEKMDLKTLGDNLTELGKSSDVGYFFTSVSALLKKK